MLSRAYLYQGDYTNCITVAQGIDLSEMSAFSYDNENYNPVYDFAVNGSPYLFPKDDFGLKGDYIPEEGDGRYGFYLAAPDTVELEELGGATLKQIQGFFSTYSSQIPVYLPGEILLDIVITSYSIHYTKLYDLCSYCFNHLVFDLGLYLSGRY